MLEHLARHLAFIQEFVLNNLKEDHGTPVNIIFKLIKSAHPDHFVAQLDESQFVGSFKAHVREGNITGITGCRGRLGGYKLGTNNSKLKSIATTERIPGTRVVKPVSPATISPVALAYLEPYIGLVQNFVMKRLGGSPIPSKQIFEMIKEKHPNSPICQLEAGQFSTSLSANVNAGNIIGIKTGRGKGGYWREDAEEPKSESESESESGSGSESESEVEAHHIPVPVQPKLINKPKKNELSEKLSKPAKSDKLRLSSEWNSPRHVWVNNKLFRVSRSFTDLENVVLKVLNGTMGHGDIVFNGKRWSCDSEFFTKIILFCFHAWYQTDSEPVLDDDSGIPAEFRIPA